MPVQQSTFGKLRLHYQHGSNNHSVSVNLTAALSYSDSAACQTAADDLSGAICNIQPGTMAYLSWDTLDPFGSLVLSGTFTSARVGVHTGTMDDWESFTITFTGKELTPGTDFKYGNTDMRVYTGGAIAITPGTKFLTNGGDITLSVLANFLATDPRFWAGFHGHKASVRGQYPVQWNAHAQRHIGA